jgi:hypothetical protein
MASGLNPASVSGSTRRTFALVLPDPGKGRYLSVAAMFVGFIYELTPYSDVGTSSGAI